MNSKHIFIITITAFISCCTKQEDFTKLLGPDFNNPKLEYSYDFTGVSTHGEKFIFREYTLERAMIAKAVRNNILFTMPQLEFINPSNNSKIIHYCRWQRVSINNASYNYPLQLITMAKTQGNSHIKNVLDFNRIDDKYFSYICTYPEGNYLFILDVINSKLFVIEKRG